MGIGNLNTCTMGLPAAFQFGINSLAMCYCDVQPAELLISNDALSIKLNNIFHITLVILTWTGHERIITWSPLSYLGLHDETEKHHDNPQSWIACLWTET
jgi:hypothetical protein